MPTNRPLQISETSLHSLIDPQGEWDYELLLDALLLASHVPVRRQRSKRESPKEQKEVDIKKTKGQEKPQKPPPTQADPTPAPSPDLKRDDDVRPGDLFDPGRGLRIEPESIRARLTRVPLPSALPRARDMAEALRPLKRRTPSRREFVLDEQASVERSAEVGSKQAVLRPKRERWLDVALIIDESRSMRLWTATLADLRRLLEAHGAFRNVATWSLNCDEPQPKLYRERSLPGKRRRIRDWKELVETEGRRLILIATDLTSPGWRSGRGFELIQHWTAASPVAVIEMLPPRLWRATPLGENIADLKSERAGEPSAGLTLFQSQRERKKLQFPILTLEPASFGSWAQMVANLGLSVAPGFASDVCPVVPLAANRVEVSHEQRVRQFRNVVSVEAFQIAAHLAVVPLSLPIMRFVQELAVDREHARLTQLAEVVLGGIAEHLPEPPEGFGANDCLYDFAKGVRQMLLPYLGKGRAVELLDLVGEQIRKRLGRSIQDFRALLADPDGPLTTSVDATAQRFAHLHSDVLKFWHATPASVRTYPIGIDLRGDVGSYSFDRIRQLLWSPDGSFLVLRALYSLEIRGSESVVKRHSRAHITGVDWSRSGPVWTAFNRAKHVTLVYGGDLERMTGEWSLVSFERGLFGCDAGGQVYPVGTRGVTESVVPKPHPTTLRRWDVPGSVAFVSACSEGTVSGWVMRERTRHEFRTSELDVNTTGRIELAVQPPFIAFAYGDVVTLLRWEIPKSGDADRPQVVCQRKLDSNIVSLAFASDHNILAIAERMGDVHLVTADSLQVRARFSLAPQESRSTALTFSKTGDLTVARFRKLYHFAIDFDLLLRTAWKPNGKTVFVDGSHPDKEVNAAVHRELAQRGYLVTAVTPLIFEAYEQEMSNLGVPHRSASGRPPDRIVEFRDFIGNGKERTDSSLVTVLTNAVRIARDAPASTTRLLQECKRKRIPLELQIMIALDENLAQDALALLSAEDPKPQPADPLLRALLDAWAEPEISDLDLGPGSLSPPQVRVALQSLAAHHGETAEAAERFFWQLAGDESLAQVFEKCTKLRISEVAFWSTKPLPKKLQDEKLRDLRDRHIPDARNLVRLTSDGYLLTLLWQAWRKNNASLARNMGTLLFSSFKELVSRGDQSVQRTAHLIRGLADIAWQMAYLSADASPEGEDGPHIWILREEAQDLLGGEEALEKALAASMLFGDREMVGFRHPLMQAVFAAHALQSRIPEFLAAALWHPNNWWQPNGWDEIAVLLAGIQADDCTPVIRWLAHAQPEVAAQCLEESGAAVANRTDLLRELQAAWLPRITGRQRDPQPEARAAVGRALGRLRLDKRIGVGCTSDRLPDIDWVAIAPGKFHYQDGSLELEEFEIARYPITNAQFEAFLDAEDGYRDARWWKGRRKLKQPGIHAWTESNHPCVHVTWFDAVAFCAWLGSKLTLNVTLPNERQWERAARGTDGRTFPWGQTYLLGYANINETTHELGPHNIGRTTAVGIYGASPEGVLDLSGNVWEWCEDHSSEGARSIRGGSWGDNASYARATFRGNYPSDSCVNYIGFRVVCSRAIP